MPRMTLAALAVALIALTVPASAKPVFDIAAQPAYGNADTPVPYKRGHGRSVVAYSSEIIGRRPAGCPRRFCGCSASIYLFGRIVPGLNLASNWYRKFPRANPAPGMAAARNGHVFVLISHAGGNDWLAYDGNSGGGFIRRHVRSINGYRIVDPSGNRFASSAKRAG